MAKKIKDHLKKELFKLLTGSKYHLVISILPIIYLMKYFTKRFSSYKILPQESIE